MSIALPFGAFETVLLEDVNKVHFTSPRRLLLFGLWNICRFDCLWNILSLSVSFYLLPTKDFINFLLLTGHSKQDISLHEVPKWRWPYKTSSNTGICATNECSSVFGNYISITFVLTVYNRCQSPVVAVCWLGYSLNVLHMFSVLNALQSSHH